MPVRFPGRDVHHVTNLELSGRLILGADEARAHGDSKDLTALMSMPVTVERLEVGSAWRV